MRPSELRGLQTQPPEPEYGHKNPADSFSFFYQFASAGGTRQLTSLTAIFVDEYFPIKYV